MKLQKSVLNYTERNRLTKKQQIAFRRFLTYEAPSHSISKYIGIPVYDLRLWVQSKMIEGMNWNNYGEVWVIDHLVPLRLFDLTNAEHLKLAWHYTNLMPLLKEDNLHKEGDLRFSLMLFDYMPDHYIAEKLKAIVVEEIKTMDKYLSHWIPISE